MVPGSRNPMWGEEFNFSVDELPVQVGIMFCYLSSFIPKVGSTLHKILIFVFPISYTGKLVVIYVFKGAAISVCPAFKLKS